MQVEETVQAPARVQQDGVAAELWLAATVLIAGCTVVMLGALSYIY
jgi:hypothetical protein